MQSKDALKKNRIRYNIVWLLSPVRGTLEEVPVLLEEVPVLPEEVPSDSVCRLVLLLYLSPEPLPSVTVESSSAEDPVLPELPL